MRAAAIALVLLGIASLASAEPFTRMGFITGEKLLTYCTTAPEGHSHHEAHEEACHAYIAGAFDSWEYGVWVLRKVGLFKPGSKPHCMPREIQVDQLKRVVVEFIEEHPERLHNYGADLVRQAIGKAFPCPDEPGG